MPEEIKFEKALEKLEKIVEDLESGDVSLDEALKKYEEGVKLSRTCQSRLSQAEKKIEVLTKSLDGSFEIQEFDSEEAEVTSKKKTKKSTKKSSSDDFLI